MAKAEAEQKAKYQLEIFKRYGALISDTIRMLPDYDFVVNGLFQQKSLEKYSEKDKDATDIHVKPLMLYTSEQLASMSDQEKLEVEFEIAKHEAAKAEAAAQLVSKKVGFDTKYCDRFQDFNSFDHISLSNKYRVTF